jgi:hypothetical protein
VASGNALSCDIRGNADGEACVEAGESKDNAAQCTVDKKARVTCVAGKTKVESCDGHGGCEPGASTLPSVCNKPVRPEATCAHEGEDACDDDGHLWLSCVHGRWETTSTCRGPAGCKFLSLVMPVACDTSFGEVGDPCATGSRCTVDHKAVLECTDHKLVKSTDCPGPKGCVPGEVPTCDGAPTGKKTKP